MKTNSNAVLKMLMLVAVALASTTHSTMADQVPFRGSAQGAAVGVSPDPAGVVLTVQAEGKARSSGASPARKRSCSIQPPEPSPD